jgi:bifunctional enzyme CysN/CysC
MPWYKGEPLLGFLEDVYIASDWNLRDARFPVQWIIRPQSEEYRDYRGYAGQIASGVFRVGEKVMVLPSGKSSRIKSIELMGKAIKTARAPMSVAILLDDEIDISRGDLIAPVNDLPIVAKEAEAFLCWMHEVPLQKGKRYWIKHTANSTKVTFTELLYRVNIQSLEEESADTLRLNEIGKVNLRSASPILFDDYYRNRQLGGFIVIDEQSNATVGAGMLLEPNKTLPTPEDVDYSI